jgi:hypothetical protein
LAHPGREGLSAFGGLPVYISASTSLKLLIAGTGSPEGAVTRGVGTVYVQTDASPTTDALWYKQTGSGNTGWVQVAASGASDAELAAIAGLTSAADKGIQFTGSGTAATYDLTAFAKTFLDDANQAAVQATLGVVPGTHVQALDAELTALAGLTSANNKIPYFTGPGTAALLDRDTDTALTANSDTSIATQKAVKAYVDAVVVTGAAPVATEAGATFTYALTDAGKYYRFTDASPQVTVPANGTIAFPVGTELHGIGTTGQVEFIEDSGVTINTPETLFTAKAYAAFTLKKVATNEWDLMGYLEPV